MTKLPEGTYNKAFIIHLDNGVQVVARLPNPNAGPSQMVTASEVATLIFARENLGIAVPRVLEWSTRPGCVHEAGADFIIMEKARGTELGCASPSLDERAQSSIVKSLAKIEGQFDSFHLPGFGSLYFADELRAVCASQGITSCEPIPVPGTDFVLGPTVDRLFWKGERASMNIDRGPWKTVHQAISANAKREIAWISQFAIPLPDGSPARSPGYAEDPKEHIKALQQYLDLVPFLPPNDPALCVSQIRHRDLHEGNIFVSSTTSPSGETSYGISDIVDWQHCAAMPLYLQVEPCRFIRKIGPADPPRVMKMEVPQLPENYETMPTEEKKKAWDQRSREMMFLYWFLQTKAVNLRQFEGITKPFSLLRIIPTALANHTWGHVWSNELYLFKQTLADIFMNWEDYAREYEVPGGSSVPTCPIDFSLEELKELDKLCEEWDEARGSLTKYMDSLGIDAEGLCSHENLDRAKALNEELMQAFIDDGPLEEREDRRRCWPFQDGVELL